VVADFHCSALELLPWIPADSPLRAMNIDRLHRYLTQKYLKPTLDIQARAAALFASLLAGHDYIAVHARGSDKITEFPALRGEDANRRYLEAIDEFRAALRLRRIFLMTDDTRLRDFYCEHYGDDVVYTACQRSNTDDGVHYQAGRDRRLLGAEVMIDAYLATGAKAFIGNGFSNVSLQVTYLKHWPPDATKLIGPAMQHAPNLMLHQW
jgi:hypothetical protein